MRVAHNRLRLEGCGGPLIRAQADAAKSAWRFAVRSLSVGIALVGSLALMASAASAAGTNGSSQWATSISGAYNAPGTMLFGTSPLSAAVSGTTNGCGTNTTNQDSNAVLVSAGAGNFYTPSAPSDAIGVRQCHNGGAAAVRTVVFNKPVIAPVFNINNLDASTLTFSAGPNGAPIALTPLSKSPPLNLVNGTALVNANSMGTAGCSNTPANPTNNSGCGSFRMAQEGGPVTSFTMTNNPKPVASADGWVWTLWYPTAPLTKEFSPNRIPVGGLSTLTFTIANPNNPGQPNLSPLDFTDVLPAGVTLADGSATNNGSCGSPTVGDSAGGDLGAGDTGVKASNISVAVGATCTITINVTSNVPTEPGPPYLNDNSNLSAEIVNLIPGASTTLAVYPVADVEIEKSSKARIVPGKAATYTLKLTNNGPSKATNAVASDPLPGGVSFVSASNGCSEAGGKVTCKVASLDAGASRTFEVDVKVASSAKCSALENTATVTNDVFDPNEGNNSSSVHNCGPESDLEINKQASSAKVADGGRLTYTLVVKNKGPSDNTNVTVQDPIPAGLSILSAKAAQGSCSTAGGKLACKLGSLQAGGSTQVLLNAKASGSAGACIKNHAEVGGEGFDPNQTNNRDGAQVCIGVPPSPPFDLVIKKTANKKRITADGNVRYTLAVTNEGPGAAPSAQVTDTFNHRGQLVSVKTTAGSCGKALPVRCSLGDIPAGAKVTITVVLKPLSTGCKQRNAASVSGEGTDTNPANNLSKVDICVAPKLRIVKTVDRSSAQAGEMINYTIKVTNLSKRIAAENVRTCDRLPSGLALASSKPRAKLFRGMPCWTKKVLKGGKSAVYSVSARVLRGASGNQRNVATTSADGSKGKALSDTAVVTVQGQAPRPTPVTG